MGYTEAQGRAPSLGVAWAAVALTTLNYSHIPGTAPWMLQSGALETLALGSQFGGGYPEAEWEAHCSSKSRVYFLSYLCDLMPNL